MFKLYSCNDGWKKLDQSYCECDIVNTMIDYHDKYKLNDFMVIKRINGSDEFWARTRNEEEYQEYMQDFNLRNESCIDLKDEITRYVKVKSLKK